MHKRYRRRLNATIDDSHKLVVGFGGFDETQVVWSVDKIEAVGELLPEICIERGVPVAQRITGPVGR